MLHGEMGVTDHNNALKLGFDPGLPGGADGRSGAYPDWILTQPYASMLPHDVPGAGHRRRRVRRRGGQEAADNAADVRVVAGTTDSVAAFAAARCTDPGDCVTSLGSSLALKLVSETRVDDAAAGVYSHRLCGRWLVGGASGLGGWLLRSNFTDDELVSLTEEVSEATGSRDGSSLSSVDYFPGVLMGFGLSVEEATARLSADRPASDAEFLRAILSSVARVEARAYAALVSMGASQRADARVHRRRRRAQRHVVRAPLGGDGRRVHREIALRGGGVRHRVARAHGALRLRHVRAESRGGSRVKTRFFSGIRYPVLVYK